VAEQAGAKLTAGELIAGRYRMVAPIAQGGMGSVWKAHDERAFGQAVAIKVVRALSVSDSVKQRFVEEAKVISTLNSPHIVSLREFGTTESNYPFFVMDLLEGQTVTERLSTEGACSERDGARILDGLLAGLQELHLQGVIHRDLKPSNVFLEQSSAIDAHVRILDLGIAQLVDGGDGPVKGRQKRVVGTPRWMAPEVLLGEPASQVSDLYSVGLLGVLILGGQIPHSKFTRDGQVQPFDRSCIIQRLGSNSVKVTGRRGMEPISDAFCHLLEDALWRAPEDRYRDALAFRTALRKALPHLGMPNLPFAHTGRSSRNISVPVEHTLLEDDVASALDEMNLGAGLTHAMEAVIDGAKIPAPPPEVDVFKPSAVGEQDLRIGAKTIVEAIDESDDRVGYLPRRRFSPFILGICAVLGGLALGWSFSSKPKPTEMLDDIGGGSQAPLVLPLSESDLIQLDRGTVTKGILAKGVRDAGLNERFEDAGEALELDVSRPKARKSRVVNRKPRALQKPKKAKKATRPKAQRKITPQVDSLGKRCRIQFQEIVRDSDGGTLVQSSLLCGRIGKLSKEANKPKCGLSSQQRKELSLLEVLCESSP
jgi:serine/threonine protein kinase